MAIGIFANIASEISNHSDIYTWTSKIAMTNEYSIKWVLYTFRNILPKKIKDCDDRVYVECVHMRK